MELREELINLIENVTDEELLEYIYWLISDVYSSRQASIE